MFMKSRKFLKANFGEISCTHVIFLFKLIFKDFLEILVLFTNVLLFFFFYLSFFDFSVFVASRSFIVLFVFLKD